jgi:hypothetical protein
MALASFLLTLLGTITLCLAIERHHVAVLRQRASRTHRLLLAAAGAFALVKSAMVAFEAYGWPFAVVAWCGALSICATGLVLLLPSRGWWVLYLWVWSLLAIIAFVVR